MKKILIVLILTLFTIILFSQNPKDVKPSFPVYNFVMRMINEGLMGLDENGRFNGGLSVSRYELAEFGSKLLDKLEITYGLKIASLEASLSSLEKKKLDDRLKGVENVVTKHTEQILNLSEVLKDMNNRLLYIEEAVTPGVTNEKNPIFSAIYQNSLKIAESVAKEKVDKLTETVLASITNFEVRLNMLQMGFDLVQEKIAQNKQEVLDAVSSSYDKMKNAILEEAGKLVDAKNAQLEEKMKGYISASVKVEVSSYKVMLDEISKEVDNIRTYMKDLESNIYDSIDRKISKELSQSLKWAEQVPELQKKVLELSDRLEKIQYKPQEIDLKSLTATIKNVVQTSIDKEVQSLNKDISTINDRINSINSEVTAMKKDISNLQLLKDRVSTAEKDISNIKLQLKDVQIQLPPLKDRIIVLEDNISSVSSELKADISQLNDEVNKNLKEIDTKISDLDSKISKNEGYIRSIKTDLNEFKSQIQVLNRTNTATITYNRKKLQELETQINNVYDTMLTSVREIENKIKEVRLEHNKDIKKINQELFESGLLDELKENLIRMKGIEKDYITLKKAVTSSGASITSIYSNVLSLDNRLSLVEKAVLNIQNVEEGKPLYDVVERMVKRYMQENKEEVAYAVRDVITKDMNEKLAQFFNTINDKIAQLEGSKVISPARFFDMEEKMAELEKRSVQLENDLEKSKVDFESRISSLESKVENLETFKKERERNILANNIIVISISAVIGSVIGFILASIFLGG